MNHRWIAYLFLLGLFCGGANAAPAGGDPAPWLQSAMTRELQQQGLAGATWSWVDAAGHIHTGAVGQANVATGQAMTPDTEVNVGSVTKTLIAVGLLRLASQGRVDLDAPVEPLLAGIRFDNPWRGRQDITLRHLLDHTAGIEDLRLWQMFTLRSDPDTPLTDTFRRDASLLKVRSQPGDQFSYSNMGYTLAAIALEQAVGERYEAWLQRELLAPLGMHDSSFALLRQDRPDGRRLAWGHLDNLQPQATTSIWLRPAGQFTTTAGDMGRLAVFLLGEGQLHGAPFIDPAYLHQMARPQHTAAARAGLDKGYALGLTRQERHGAIGRCHTGSIVGYHAMFCVYPEHHRAFFVSHNTDAEDADYGRFDALLIRALSLPAVQPSPTRPLAAGSTAWAGQYVIESSRFSRFRYLDLLSNTLSLDMTDDASALRMQRQGVTSLLQPVGPGLFAAPGMATASHVLLGQADGNPRVSDGLRTWRKSNRTTTLLLWGNLLLGAGGLCWFLLTVPWRVHPDRLPRPWPAWSALILLLIPPPLLAAQGMLAMGDRTPASVLLLIGTALVAPLLLWQLVRSLTHRRRSRWHTADALAAVTALAWLAVLGVNRLLPVALWEI